MDLAYYGNSIFSPWQFAQIAKVMETSPQPNEGEPQPVCYACGETVAVGEPKKDPKFSAAARDFAMRRGTDYLFYHPDPKAAEACPSRMLISNHLHIRQFYNNNEFHHKVRPSNQAVLNDPIIRMANNQILRHLVRPLVGPHSVNEIALKQFEPIQRMLETLVGIKDRPDLFSFATVLLAGTFVRHYQNDHTQDGEYAVTYKGSGQKYVYFQKDNNHQGRMSFPETIRACFVESKSRIALAQKAHSTKTHSGKEKSTKLPSPYHAMDRYGDVRVSRKEAHAILELSGFRNSPYVPSRTGVPVLDLSAGAQKSQLHQFAQQMALL